MEDKISDSQRSYLLHKLAELGIDENTLDKWWPKLAELTDTKYRYFLALTYNGGKKILIDEINNL